MDGGYSPGQVRLARVLEQVRAKPRLKCHAVRTKVTEFGWFPRFMVFHGRRHPCDPRGVKVVALRNAQAVEMGVAASTRNKVVGALLFLGRNLVEIELSNLDVVRARRFERLSVGRSHGFGAHLLEASHGCRIVQELLSHCDVSMGMIYTRVLQVGLLRDVSLIDVL